jgi:DNA/RNA endonuclease YhcR with UshA esterase domain
MRFFASLGMTYLFLFFLLLFSCGRRDEKYQEFMEERHEPSTEVKEDTSGPKQLKVKPSDIVVSPVEASAYVGKYVTVKGYIAQVNRREKVAYLNFVEEYPKNPFTAVIFASRFSDFGNIQKYEHKDVEVTGIVSTYKGHAQIILNDPSQIKMVR